MAKRTVKQARGDLRPPENKPVVWSTWRRKLHYGMTEAAVRRRLVTVKFCGRKVACHRLVAGPLARVEARIRAYEKRHPDLTPWTPGRIDCFNWRAVRGGTSLSHHAHAIAFDIDPATNPYYSQYTARATMTTPKRVLQSFADEGFTLGMMWDRPCDTMHFQWR